MKQVHRAGHAADGPSTRAESAAASGEPLRGVHRIVIDVLAVPTQVPLLMDVLGTAICGRPDDHDGPCRLAWRMTADGDAHERRVHRDEELRIRRSLEALEAWPVHRATTDLAAEVDDARRGAAGTWASSGRPATDVPGSSHDGA